MKQRRRRDGIAKWSELSMRYAPKCMHLAIFRAGGDAHGAHDAGNRMMGWWHFGERDERRLEIDMINVCM